MEWLLLLVWLLAVGCTSELPVLPATSTKWESSKVWPAVDVEHYETGYPDATNTMMLNAHNWDWRIMESVHHSMAVKAILQAAHERVQSFLLRTASSQLSPKPSTSYATHNGNELTTLQGIRIVVDNGTAILEHGVDESYEIHIPYLDDKHSWINLHAPTVYGILRGMETVQQLLQFVAHQPPKDTSTTRGRAAAYFAINDTPLCIHDAPAYLYRGLMIDTARHFLPITLIRHNLHVMAANKLNVLHWHMTDSQSWPYHSERFPELAAAAAHCPECLYHKHDIQSVIREAAILGIRVIVELDLPGHSQGELYPFLLERITSVAV
jgi:Glycosyl hydrolase family 20, catalytic domain/beta-acetyl hexosaminidase like